MNNYLNFKNYDYTNMYNNAFNNPYKDIINQYKNELDIENQNSNNLYDPYNGLIRGNLFKKLYEPYNGEEPYEIKPMNEQAQILTKIDALEFALVDLNLLLDINSKNKDAIDLFNKYRNEKDELIKKYEQMYGPITLNSNVLDSYPWAWINMPWPWDN